MKNLEQWNNTKHDYPKDKCLCDLFESQASKTPDSVAVIFENSSLTYNELNQAATNLAKHLRENGVGPNVLVGVYMQRSLEMVIGLLGILKAGGAYVPLDPTYPSKRLSFMLSDAQVSILLTQRELLHHLPEHHPQTICLEDVERDLMQHPAEKFQSSAQPHNLAYVIYTSGSTGKPKGVQIPQNAVINFLTSMGREPGLTCDDILLSVTTLSFDIHVLEIFLPLIVGGCTVIVSRETALDGNQLLKALRNYQATIMQATPTTWRLLLAAGWQGEPRLKVLCGGEPFPKDLAKQLLPHAESVWNMYGPTETTVWSSCYRISNIDEPILIGKPIANTRIYILDRQMQQVDIGVPGELYIGGAGVTPGYLNRPALTNEKFVSDPFSTDPQARLYKTGDIARFQPDGNIEYLHRVDAQVKVRGFRIELGEIEAAMVMHPDVKESVASVITDPSGNNRLVGYVVLKNDTTFTVDALRGFLQNKLPDYMVPGTYVVLDAIPLTPNGKIDRNALPRPSSKRPSLGNEYIAPSLELEKKIAEIWCKVLEIDSVGILDNFFDLGGTSLLLLQVNTLLQQTCSITVPIVKFFQYPTIKTLAHHLAGDGEFPSSFKRILSRQRHPKPTLRADKFGNDGVAIIGMAGRFPGADNLSQFWDNLCNGVESISFFHDDDLDPGIDDNLKKDPNYVKARGIVKGADLFDASFFGINPTEAEVMDPQHRVFLELAWEALENAGYDSDSFDGLIGVYAAVGDNYYYHKNVLSRPDLVQKVGALTAGYGNEKDYIALRVSHKLNLTGPSLSINTACSASLVTVDTAFNNLMNFQCDMALAGGVDISVPQKRGHIYQKEGAFCKDGHCRPFDAQATGTMFCDGAGVVVLKRLEDALKDGDTVYAVIRGSALNNDGSNKVSFLAPSVEGQAMVVAMAQASAGVHPESISYVESHGTATPLGDPIEIEALTKAFRLKTDKTQFCGISSLKGNIGHPTIAAGVAGLIKTALALKNKKLPPTLNYDRPNHKIDFESTPFYVIREITEWDTDQAPRRAGVSSFGFGGTNAHVILEEAPTERTSGPSRPKQLLLLSAKTKEALENATENLCSFINSRSDINIADVAYTLQTGRKYFAHRRFVVCDHQRNGNCKLDVKNPNHSGSHHTTSHDPGIVFMFPGQGSQYFNMGSNLYRHEPVFRLVVDQCAEILKPFLETDLREVLYSTDLDPKAAKDQLRITRITQPALFTIELALARLWQSWGIHPQSMIGHSVGEFTCACLSDVFSLEDALKLVAKRGQLMQELPEGSMLAVLLPEAEIEPLLPSEVSIAAVNGPSLTVASGPKNSIQHLRQELRSRKIMCRRLQTSHAFHSPMVDPAILPFASVVRDIKLSPPKIPFISTVTKNWITPEEATDPMYWARHMRETVRFAEGIQKLWQENPSSVMLEVGPGTTATTCARQLKTDVKKQIALSSLSETADNNAEWSALSGAVGHLWLHGVRIDWNAFYTHEQRRRVPLPTYPFERRRHWVEPMQVDVNRVSTSSKPPSKPVQTSVSNQSILDSVADINNETIDTISTREDQIQAQLIEILVPAWGKYGSVINSSATFLEQGFDSLSLTQVAFEIRKKFGVEVSFNQLMKEYPNVEMLTAHIVENLPENVIQKTSPAPKSTPADPASENQAVHTDPDYKQLENKIDELERRISKLSALIEKSGIPADQDDLRSAKLLDSTIPQRGIYFSSRLSDNLSATYNESVTIKLEGTIDSQKLKNAVNRLVDRHDALRASFDESGKMMQIAPTIQVEIEESNFTHLEKDAKEESFKKLLAEETAVLFPLPNGPLFRSKIIVLDSHSAAIVLTGHHTICDGWSLDVLIHDFCAFYSEEITGNKISLPEVSSYTDYVRMVSARTNSPEYKTAQEFWQTKFASGFPALVLPADQPRTGQRKFAARRKEVRIDSEKTQLLRSLAANQGWSFFALVLGAYSILLARISRQHNFVIALPTAEQPVQGQSDLVGHCVNMLPFEVYLKAEESVHTFLTKVQEDLAASHEYAFYTTTHILEQLRPAKRMPGIIPISAGMTSVKKWLPAKLPQEGFAADYDINVKSFESFELYVTALEDGDELILRSSYDTGLFNDSTVDRWLEDFGRILADISANPSRDLYEVAKVDPENANRASENIFLFIEDSRATPDTGYSGVPSHVHISSPNRSSSHSSARELETQLIKIWQGVLGIRNIGLDDNFFDLGGNSMAAARLFAAIEKDLNFTLPLSILFESPTPHSLTRKILGRATHSDWQPLVPINAQGSRRPLFLIHGAEGNVLIYRPLSLHLGEDQPVYGLQAAGLDGSELGDVSFDKVACRYIKEIQTVQPHGPYMLGGYCLGGTIALEMAHQLKAMGESVSFIAMFENYNIKAIQWPQPTSVKLCNKILNVYYHFLNLISAYGDRLAFFKEKLKVEISRTRIFAQTIWEETRRLIGKKDDHLHHLKVGEAYDQALTRYELKPYSGRVALFLANKCLVGFNVPKGGWGDTIKDGLEVYTLPINPRGSMIEPYVRDLALRLRALLDET